MSGVDEALLPFYGQELDWSRCGDGFDCTTVTAPLDWAEPAKGSCAKNRRDSRRFQG